MTKGVDFERITVRFGDRRVLNQVSGGVRVGEILVVMGPSGSGKSTLLSALAGEIPVAAESKISLAGRLGYAAQFDRLLPFVTVEETLGFSVALRGVLPAESGEENRVENLLDLFDLVAVRSSVVGTAEKRRISGGELKRLGVATEVASDPDVLLCDEPTSSLDAASAMRIVRVLAGLKTMAVCATVHQPSSRLFALFQQVMVLTRHGSVLYSGDAKRAAAAVRSRRSGKDFEDLPAAEFVLEAALEADVTLATSFAAPVALRVEEDDIVPRDNQRSRSPTRIFGQLLRRALLSNARSPTATRAALGRSLAMGLVVGLLYSSGAADDQKGAADRTGAVFFVVVNQAYSAVASIRVFLEERTVLEHETRRGAYGIAAYFVAKTLAELPSQAAFAAVFGTLAYYFAGLRRDLAAGLAHAGIVALATLVAESLALFVGAAAPDAKTAVALGPAALSVFLLFAGFLVSLDSLPPCTRILQAASLFRHAFAALVKIEFDTPATFDCSTWDRAQLAADLRAAGLPANRVAVIQAKLPCPTPDARTHLSRLLGATRASTPILQAELPALLVLFVVYRAAALLALVVRTRPARRAHPSRSRRNKLAAATSSLLDDGMCRWVSRAESRVVAPLRTIAVDGYWWNRLIDKLKAA